MPGDKNINVLERGHIFFFYRPPAEEESSKGLEDISRLLMVLHPEEKNKYRLIVVGKKKMPEKTDQDSKGWGFVDKVTDSIKNLKDELEEKKYITKTRGERGVPHARSAGEGVYSIVSHDDHVHLAYATELPKRSGQAQEDLKIKKEGNYIVSVKNPQSDFPPTAGLGKSQKADFTEDLKNRFGDRRFIPLNPPDFLDHEGAEILMVEVNGLSSDLVEANLDPQEESKRSTDIFSDLRLEKAAAVVEPLFEGEWE